MMEDKSPANNFEETDFLSSVIEIEMEHWENDLAGTKAVLMALGCTAQKAEAALGSYLCPRSESRICFLPGTRSPRSSSDGSATHNKY
jgi:hypothetical protein